MARVQRNVGPLACLALALLPLLVLLACGGDDGSVAVTDGKGGMDGASGSGSGRAGNKADNPRAGRDADDPDGAAGDDAVDGGNRAQPRDDAAVSPHADASIDGGHNTFEPTHPFDDVMRLPDVSTDAVSSCAGELDMALCDVVTTPDRQYDVCIEGDCFSPGCDEVSCNTAGPRFRMPPVFDHHYFERDGGDEPVVVDLITGLHWQGCLAGLMDQNCYLGNARTFGWSGALSYCDELQWAGHDDWYLPDPYEWASLYTLDKSAYRDDALFPGNLPEAWANVTDGWGNKWAVDNLFRDWQWTYNVHVRCVRRGSSRPVPPNRLTRFAPVQDTPEELIVRDAATGLDWQACLDCERDGSTGELNYGAALAYCDTLRWAGFSDWRLPTAKEHLTTQNFRSLQGSSFNPFDAFHRTYASFQGYAGDPITNPTPQVLTINGTMITPGDDVTFPTVCVRYGPYGE